MISHGLVRIGGGLSGSSAGTGGVGGGSCGVDGLSAAQRARQMGKKKQVPEGKGPSALFLFAEDNFVRKQFKFIVDWPVFEYAVLVTIISNCVVLAMEEHLPGGDRTVMAIKLEETEPYFLGIFTVEMTVKILANGFCLHGGSYLRNIWNIMDFVVVVTGYITMFADEDLDLGIDLRTLRAIRVLRPLKLVSGVPSLQVVLKSILKAMAPLLQIALLVLFAIVIFAIIGLEFYSGALHKTCYKKEDLTVVETEGEQETPCYSADLAMAARAPGEQAPKPPAGSYICEGNYSECIEKWIGPNYGITSFDNIFFSMLTVFQVRLRHIDL